MKTHLRTMALARPFGARPYGARPFGIFAFCLALALACGSCAFPSTALAEGRTTPLLGNLQQVEIETLETAYRDAATKAAEAKARVAENQAKIDAVMRKLPAQQARTDAAMRELYSMESNKLMYVDMILGAESLDDFLRRIEYFDRVGRVNLDELNKLKNMLAELEEARKELDAAQAEADEQAQLARDALATLQDERANKQHAGQAAALAQDGSGAIVDGADWHTTEEEFVAAWAPRLNAYLAGSPLDGQGEAFALSAFRYCIDPRWSAAISNTESSKGRLCIRPHNAWGWGAADSDPYNLASEWATWEDAIDAHARGLAKGYGYTISKSAAKKYCSSPDSWYANTLSEMARI